MDVNMIIPYVEPIYRFCCKRLDNRYDAEDLSSEIICHVLSGMKKYPIKSLDAWVWQIAHNRYARFMNAQNKSQIILAEDEVLFNIADSDYCNDDEEWAEHEFEAVFRCLHTLSCEYRNIFIDYYIGEMPVRMLSKKYSLPETTIKWRLNVGRQKIRERIYFNNEIYHGRGTRWLCANGIPQGSKNGVVKKDSLTDEDIAVLIQNNLVVKSGEDYKLNFACFTESQFAEFISLFELNNEHLDQLLTDWIIAVRKSFVKFIPARLDGQINQWVSTYLYQMIGYVVDELIRRGTLKKPDLDKPLTDGVFYVAGKYIDP